MKYLVPIIMFTTLLFSATLDWPSDYDRALIQAKKENKFVYVLITSDSCRWCRKFEETTLQNKQIKERIKREYIAVHLSRNRHTIPPQFKTSPVPRHYFVDQKGENLFNTIGHRDEEMMNSFMDNAIARYKKRNEGIK